jgi:hypothetical protein
VRVRFGGILRILKAGYHRDQEYELTCSTLVLPILYKMALWGSICVIVWPQIPDSAREYDTLVKVMPTETPANRCSGASIPPNGTNVHLWPSPRAIRPARKIDLTRDVDPRLCLQLTACFHALHNQVEGDAESWSLEPSPS